MPFAADRIVDAFATVFQADPDLTALIPGDLWHRRADAEEHGGVRPYAILSCVPGEKEFISDGSYLQDFGVQITLYGDESVTGTGAVANYLDSFDLNRTVLLATDILPGRLVSVFPAPENLDTDPGEKLGKDVIVAARAWTVKLHIATRGVQ